MFIEPFGQPPILSWLSKVMFNAEQRAKQSLKEMQTASQPAVFDIFPAQSEVHCKQQENPHLSVTSGCRAQDLLREEIYR